MKYMVFMIIVLWLVIQPDFKEVQWTSARTPVPEEKISGCTTGDNKVALIIAVGDYAKEGDHDYITPATRSWADINSKNDIPLIKSSLKAQGFCDQNIHVITDGEATKEGILSAIQKYLIDKVKAGDVAFLHYSGHGQQIMDDNGDEADGWDEALVPHNAPVKFVANVYEGEQHLRDDDLGRLLTVLRAKLGRQGHLLVTIDACHSGTATRGIGSSRGSAIKLAPPDYNPLASKEEKFNLLEWDLNARGDLEEMDIAPYVIISGAGADELNYETFDPEGNKVGSLSYALSKSLSFADQNTTYAALFDRIKLDMATFAPRQTPQIEGNINLGVLNGHTIPQPVHYKVKAYLNKKNAVLNAGHLFGLFEGTQVAFYDFDADTALSQPKALGTIVHAYPFEADVELDRTLQMEDMLNSWVYVVNKNFGSVLINLKLDIKENDVFANALREGMENQTFIRLVAADPDLLIEMNNEHTNTKGKHHLQIITWNDYVFFEKQINESNTDQEVLDIIKQTLAYAQAKYLRNLELRSDELNVKLGFIPVEVEQAGRMKKVSKRLSIEEKKNSEGLIEFKVDDHFIFTITNHGSKDAYYCVLDIQPDNVINALIPYGNRTATEYKIKAGETTELPDIYSIGEPVGLESLKLIATAEPIDLKPLVASRGATMRSSQNPLETLLSYSYKLDQVGKRGAKTQSIPPAMGNIHTVVFKIVK